MNVPFTTEQFLSVFRDYNTAVFPAQIIAYISAFLILWLIYAGKRNSNAYACGVLMVMWLWMGIVYHIMFFSSINSGAYIFGAFFIMQGFLFLYSGVLRKAVVFRFSGDVYAALGFAFILYAMIFYPLLGIWAGHGYPHAPMFGIAPCPTTIFTFGILLLTLPGIPKKLLIIPAVWSMLGVSAAMNFGIYEDAGLPVAGILGTALLIFRERSLKAI